MNRTTIIAILLISVLIIPIGIAIQVGVYNECRTEGHSFFYCMNLVSRK